MQHDLDYDRAWDKISRKFWRRRRRELGLHFALFVIIQLVIFAITPVPVLEFNVGYSILGVYVNWVSIPWISIAWGSLLLAHLATIIGAAWVTSHFRYNVERELLRDFARVNSIDEKRKMRPSYAALSDEDEAFDIIDEAQEVSSRQSAR